MLKYFILLIMLILLTACEDKITTSCEEDTGNIDVNQPVSFAEIQNKVFSVYCTSCHSDPGASGDLNLSAGQTYANLVNVGGISTGLLRVKPGKSDSSLLVMRIKNIGGLSVMPPIGELPQPYIDLIVRWIDEGAINN
jgi:hypothetical protein